MSRNRDDQVRQNPPGRIKQLEQRRRHSILKCEIADLAVDLAWDSMRDAARSASSPILSGPPSDIMFPDPAKDIGLHHMLKNTASTNVVQDLYWMVGEETNDNRTMLQSEYAISMCKKWGYTSEQIVRMSVMQRRKLAKRLLRHMKEEDAKRDAQFDRVSQSDEYIEEHLASDIEEVAQRLNLPFKLEHPQGSSLHHLSEFLKEHGDPESSHIIKDIDDGLWQIFVVEHDWAAAFRGSQDFDSGNFPLPYNFTAFEFRVNGMRIVMMMVDDDSGTLSGHMAIGINKRWYLNRDHFTFTDGKISSATLGKVIEPWRGAAENFLSNVAEQIRAVCIMLDAQVAEHETVRAPHRLNEERARRGKAPVRDYNVVSLSRRYRAKPMGDHVVTPGTKRRLHFRRGHWRHYADHKTWINWMLVGDPDLGFVDKHYKL